MRRDSVPRFRVVADTGAHGGHLLRVSGPLDGHTVERLVAAIDELAPSSAGTTVDLGDVSFCDSPALQRLEDHVAALRQHDGVVTVQHPSPSVVRIMDAEDTARDRTG